MFVISYFLELYSRIPLKRDELFKKNPYLKQKRYIYNILVFYKQCHIIFYITFVISVFFLFIVDQAIKLR